MKNIDFGTKSTIEGGINEISNQTIHNFVNKATDQRRDVQLKAVVKNTLEKYNRQLSFQVELEGVTYEFSIAFVDGRFLPKALVTTKLGKVVYELKPNKPLYTTQDVCMINTPLGYVIDNLRAGYRQKLKAMCETCLELNGKLPTDDITKVELNESEAIPNVLLRTKEILVSEIKSEEDTKKFPVKLSIMHFFNRALEDGYRVFAYLYKGQGFMVYVDKNGGLDTLTDSRTIIPLENIPSAALLAIRRAITKDNGRLNESETNKKLRSLVNESLYSILMKKIIK